MNRKITFVQYGCGKMGKYLIRYAIEKGAQLVAAFDMNPALFSRDAAEIVGRSCRSVSPVSWRRPGGGFLTLVNRILWQKPHNCGFFMSSL